VSAVMSMCAGAGAVVRSVCGDDDCFGVKVGVHHGSALRPLLFVTVMEALSVEFRAALPWELLRVGRLVEVAETEDDLLGGLSGWRDGVESGGLG